MARPSQEVVEAFMRITGASESLALRKLEEYRGNINAAVNAHFSEGHNYSPYYAPTILHHNYATMNGDSQRGILPLVNAVRSFRPSLLLDPNYRRHLFKQIRRSPSTGPPPSISQRGGMGPVPPEFNSLPAQPPHLARRPTYKDENHTSSSRNQEIGNDIEDGMIKAAIEASKQDSFDLEHLQRQLQQEDDDLAHAISLSLRMAKQEKAIHELQVENKDEDLASRVGRREPNSSESKGKGNASFHQQPEKDDFYYKEWGGITSKEFNESVLLEAALFSKVSERFSDNSLPVTHLQNDQIQGTNTDSNLQLVPCFSLPSSTTQQSQRQQEEMGRIFAAQGASFPLKPNDKDTVSILLRMPDGCRHECCFLKSDKLQLLFNFIDNKVAMKPGSYRVVRPYPRCAFGVDDGSMMLRELGLTGRQEALFLELI